VNRTDCRPKQYDYLLVSSPCPEPIASMQEIKRVLMCRGALSVYKSNPLRNELTDNSPPTYTQPLGLQLHS
jgi:hypothetical protein